MGQRDDKTALYDAFASLGQALASGRRVEILDVLANGERNVARLARELNLTVPNVSQHLQILRRAGLVAVKRDGTFVRYRLASPDVHAFLGALRSLAADRVAEVDRLATAYFRHRDELEPVTRKELSRRLGRADDIVVLDVRPEEEYRAGHVPRAISIPVSEIRRRLSEIPRDRDVVAYCRGPFCAFAHDAVRELRRAGIQARRLEDGLPEWAAAGLPLAEGAAS